MEENEFLNEDDEITNEQQLYLMKKIFDSVMVFNSHFAYYIKENNIDLFNRAIDYAKTFTEEDVPGIIMNYIEEDLDDNETTSS